MEAGKFNLNLIRIFLTVYRSGSISSAVNQLHLTQPAISNAIRRLNDLLDCQLFVLKGRNIQPTPEARDLYQRLSQPYEEILQALSGFNAFEAATSARHFTVALSSYFDHIMPAIATNFEQDAPFARLVRTPYNFEKHKKGLVDGSLDLMLTAVDQLTADMTSMPLGTDKLILVCRKNHPLLTAGKSVDMATIKRLRFASLNEEHEVAMPAYFLQYEMGANIYIRVPSFGNLVDLARETNQVALLPRSIASHYLKDIDCFDLPIRSSVIHLKVAWGQQNNSNQGHRWLRQMIGDVYSESQS